MSKTPAAEPRLDGAAVVHRLREHVLDHPATNTPEEMANFLTGFTLALDLAEDRPDVAQATLGAIREHFGNGIALQLQRKMAVAELVGVIRGDGSAAA